MMRTTIAGSEIGYDVRGEGPALLCVHAFPFDRRMWQDTQARLADRYRVVTLDLPGFGESPAREGLTIEGMAEIAAGLLDHLGLPMAALAGVSMGGYVALAFAERFPHRLAALVLCDTRASADSPEALKARDDGIRKVRDDGTAEFLDGIPFRLLSARADDALRRRVRGLAEQRADGIVAALQAMRDRPDRTAVLARLRCPTLVVVGADDTVTPPAEVQAMARAIPGARFVELAGAGHLANLEAPDAFHRALAEFLDEAFPR